MVSNLEYYSLLFVGVLIKSPFGASTVWPILWLPLPTPSLRLKASFRLTRLYGKRRWDVPLEEHILRQNA